MPISALPGHKGGAIRPLPLRTAVSILRRPSVPEAGTPGASPPWTAPRSVADSGKEAGPEARPESLGPRHGVSRQERFRLVIDLVASRIYVLDRDGKPVDRYLTSPGTARHPTRGEHFTIRRAIVRPSWNPPKAAWARALKPVGPGPGNPMGVLKLDLGEHGQYIHGSPSSARGKLGRPASHGCLRMSDENVLHLYKYYAGVGSQVDVLRDPVASRKLAERFEAAGGRDRGLEEGFELVDAAWKGRLPEPATYRDLPG